VDILRLEGLLLLLPGAQLESRRRAGKADGKGEVRRDHQAKDQAVPPAIAAALWGAKFGQGGKWLGEFGALVVALVDDETATGQAIVAQDHAYTRH